MTVTIANLIPRVRYLLEDNPNEDYNTSDPSTTSPASFNVNSPQDWAESDWMEFQDTGEIILVRTGGGNPIIGKRGHFGTTTSAHPTSTPIMKNPVWKYSQISEALTRMVDELWPRAWKLSTTSVIPLSGTQWYDLGSTFEDIVSVQQVTTGSISDVVDYGSDPGFSYFVKKNMPTTLAASGNGITFPNSFANFINTVLVNFRAQLTTSDIDDGLMSEVLIYGAAWRLAAGKVLKWTGDQTMAQGKVPPTNAAVLFQQTYNEKLTLLHRTLLDQIPPRRRWVS